MSKNRAKILCKYFKLKEIVAYLRPKLFELHSTKMYSFLMTFMCKGNCIYALTVKLQ